MSIQLQFLGAAQNVTGSSYLLEVDSSKILVDCGLYQEREFRSRNWHPFPVDPKGIDAVLLTHAHLDHCGLLPKLAREGFAGKIICTRPTEEIVKIVLSDSARIQEEDARFKKKRHKRERRKGRYPEQALYGRRDAEKVFSLFQSVGYEELVTINNTISVTFHDAGHILGSSMVKVKVISNQKQRTILFSGDVGRWNKPIIRDPSLIEEADYILGESTYGDRRHEGSSDVKGKLCEIINCTVEKGGNVIIPSFAIERTQELMYHLSELLYEDRIPHLLTFLDSPMAINVTEVFKHHREYFDQEMLKLIDNNESPLHFPSLVPTRRVSESKAINRIKASCIIVAGSGMCTGGRIKYHLASNISRPESTILFIGYQARGTLGREIVEGAEKVRILGRMRPVKASIRRIDGFSAHADQSELLRWLSGFRSAPKDLFVVHGEQKVTESFAEVVRKNHHWNVSVPEYLDKIALS
ncbi:Ribonuclease [subsurface metagenome]